MTTTNDLSEDLRSFVTFALAMKPNVRFQRQPDRVGPSVTMSVTAESSGDDADRDMSNKFSDLESIMEKYRPLRPFLQSIIASEESTTTCTPITSFQANTEYRLVRISQGQFEVAKEVAAKLDLIHVLREAGHAEEAGGEYDKLHEYLGNRRQLLMGDFKGVRFADA